MTTWWALGCVTGGSLLSLLCDTLQAASGQKLIDLKVACI